MYRHHIDNMVEALGALVSNPEEARTVLTDYWKDKIADVWTAEDVIEWAEAEGTILSAEEAQDVLDYMLKYLDAERGLNWTSLESAYHLSRTTKKGA